MVKNGCSQSDHEALKLTVSLRISGWNELILHAGANSGKLKFILLILKQAWSRMCVDIYLVHETLKSAVS